MNRTVQFFGQGYGTIPASIVVKLEDLTIFSGEIPTIAQSAYNTDPSDQVVLFTCELPVTFEGLKPMSVEVLAGTVVMAQIHANYCFYNSEDLYFNICPGQDARKNVKINGELQTPAQDLPGTWSWTVPVGSTLSYDLNVIGGTES
jgi:hypothetical protein